MPRRARSERRILEPLFGVTSAAPRAICASARYPSWTGKRTRSKGGELLFRGERRVERSGHVGVRAGELRGADDERRRRVHARVSSTIVVGFDERPSEVL